MEYNLNFCVNLDKRDSTGKPTVTKTPADLIKGITENDVVHFSISIIENGVETELKTAKLWNEIVQLEKEKKE